MPVCWLFPPRSFVALTTANHTGWSVSRPRHGTTFVREASPDRPVGHAPGERAEFLTAAEVDDVTGRTGRPVDPSVPSAPVQLNAGLCRFGR
eukprot:3710914-Alexandrium_andersonii.AAC.1